MRRTTPEVGARAHRNGIRHFGTSRFDHGVPIAKIDTTPMVFVALLLAVAELTVWLAANSFQSHALLIDLPQPYPHSPEWFASPPPYMTVEISEQGQVTVDGTPVRGEHLSETIKAKQMEWPIVLFRPHPDADYRSSLLALGAIVEAGVHGQDICFDGLHEHRTFDSASLMLRSTDLGTFHLLSMRRSDAMVAPISGCGQFNPPLPLF